ncbi:MAG: hypothetical protein KDD70_07770, partial [Bdellovibrionales bacterium]|nr:hypothetical protein [Bdellovibrionales bacterium]
MKMLLKYRQRPESFLFSCTGIHAGRYLHSRTTQDILSLKSNQSGLAGCLNAKGQIEGLFTILCVEPSTHYLLVSDGGDSQLVRDALLRFKVADQLDLSLVLDSSVIHIIPRHSDLPLPKELLDFTLYVIPSTRGRSPGVDLIIPRTELKNALSVLSAIGAEMT